MRAYAEEYSDGFKRQEDQEVSGLRRLEKL
jgi:hypothetical protein